MCRAVFIHAWYCLEEEQSLYKQMHLYIFFCVDTPYLYVVFARDLESKQWGVQFSADYFMALGFSKKNRVWEEQTASD